MASVLPLPRCTPESIGLSSSQVEACLQALCHPETTMNGFMAARHGQVFAEGWWAPYAPDLVHSNHSFGKSYTATAVGIAAGEGLLSLDEKMSDIFADEIASRGIEILDERMKRITVRHVLTMSGGMKRMSDISGDWIGHYFLSEMAWEPGERFLYNSAGSCMLGALVEKRAGKSVKAYLSEKLFRKIGIDEDRFVWLNFQNGMNAEPGTFAATEDNLRLAMLYAHGGRWNGAQALPAWFVREALSVHVDTSYAPEQKDGRCGYGYQLWACSIPGVFRFDGGQGQYGIIWPEKELAVSIHEGAWAHKGPQATLDALYETLLKPLADEPLPENPQAYERLKAAEAALALPDDKSNSEKKNLAFSGHYTVTAGDAEPWFAVAPPGTGDFFVEFRDKRISAALHSVALRITEEACEITFNDSAIFIARWDGKLERRFAENTVFPALGAYAATARFLSDKNLEVTIHWLNGWFRTDLRFTLTEKNKLRIASDRLRLCVGAEGLKGVSWALRDQ